jgi:homocysteine S-methyltransferase
MGFIDTINSGTIVLTEGSVVERVRRDSEIALDPHVANAALVRDPAGRAVLDGIYRKYLDVAREYNRPMIILAPTWRANPERAARAGIGDADTLNHECVEFVSSIRDGDDDIRDNIFVGGLLACRNDAYRAEQGLGEEEAEEFHKQQANALAGTRVDFIMASTLPARSEAIGIARALAGTGKPYVLSFIVRADGTLLDGSPLRETIDRIDATVTRTPIFYALNCVHPSVCEQALGSMSSGEKIVDGRGERNRCESVFGGGRIREGGVAFDGAGAREAEDVLGRIKGLQANTSLKSPEELDGLESLDSEDPESFAGAMIRVHRRLKINVLGGCCGTDERHIRAIALGLREDGV